VALTGKRSKELGDFGTVNVIAAPFPLGFEDIGFRVGEGKVSGLKALPGGVEGVNGSKRLSDFEGFLFVGYETMS
jgi:hypothetical protein